MIARLGTMALAAGIALAIGCGPEGDDALPAASSSPTGPRSSPAAAMSYGRNTAEIWFPRGKRTGGTRSSDRDGLLDRVQQHLTHRDEVYFGEPDHYYVNSLAYLPFLARAGRYRAPDQPGGLVLD